ncbi:MAG: outer membrane protein assembly factor BamD, partial [Pseudomonadota bacterium]
VAAANRGRYVVENFDSSPSVPDALAIMAKAYAELGLEDLQTSTVAVLKHNYPQHPDLDANGNLVYEKGKRGKQTMLNVVSFGLLD